MEHRPASRVLACAFAMCLIAGCSDNASPSAAEAGNDLKKHTTSLLSAINAQDVKIAKDEVSSNGCAKAKSKHLYSVSASKRSPGNDAPDLLVTLMTGALSKIAKYEITNPHTGRPLDTRLYDKQTRTALTLRAPERAQIEIIGTTDCLSTK